MSSDDAAWKAKCEQMAGQIEQEHQASDDQQAKPEGHAFADWMGRNGILFQQAGPSSFIVTSAPEGACDGSQASEDAKQQAWRAKCEQMASRLAASAVADAKPTQGLPSISQEGVLQLLQREDEPLIPVLSVLRRQLQAWEPFDDHETSESTGVLSRHSKAERMLAAAVCDLVNGLADHQIEKTAEQLADQILAEVKAETLAYKSTARLRLRRLISFVDQWQDKCPDDDERTQLVGICTELLHLCDHLGIVMTSQQAGGAR